MPVIDGAAFVGTVEAIREEVRGVDLDGRVVGIESPALRRVDHWRRRGYGETVVADVRVVDLEVYVVRVDGTSLIVGFARIEVQRREDDCSGERAEASTTLFVAADGGAGIRSLALVQVAGGDVDGEVVFRGGDVEEAVLLSGEPVVEGVVPEVDHHGLRTAGAVGWVPHDVQVATGGRVLHGAVDREAKDGYR
ncbi:MAG: hypothetical protein KC731_35900 [Myxococcales bacterium]|nr:hypothetical protein [Myxococcales bacterium]